MNKQRFCFFCCFTAKVLKIHTVARFHCRMHEKQLPWVSPKINPNFRNEAGLRLSLLGRWVTSAQCPRRGCFPVSFYLAFNNTHRGARRLFASEKRNLLTLARGGSSSEVWECVKVHRRTAKREYLPPEQANKYKM